MQKRISLVFFVAITLSAIVITAGCQKQAKISPRQERLVLNENIQLKKQLKACRKEVEKQKNLLKDCEKQKDQIQKQADEAITFLMEDVPTALIEEQKRLTEENAELKSQIKRLQSQIAGSNEPD